MPDETGYHYSVIRRAIDAIDASQEPQTLDALASKLSMSPTHFQRVFSRWVGVSPKRYQQYLALDHARSLLANNFTTLETAHELGLSGGSRLHDMFVKWEAMTPGEYARKGAGLQISYGWFNSPFGRVLALGTDRGLCGLAFAEETGDATALADMTSRWPRATFTHGPERVEKWVNLAFGPAQPMQLHLIGAPFQIKVWQALLAIPSGTVTTYSEIATAIGSPRAARAVGTAVGKNPISWLIPCHRALRKSGGLGGYHWGLPVKRAMLAWEAARLEAKPCNTSL
ncbi:MAG: methylated-DNA--[protein]-cysteine S-methyltransferase [Paracoccaceae bacterium]